MPRAGIKFTGDFKKLKEWGRRFDNVSKEGMDIVANQLAEETLDLVKEGFEKSRDPTGKPWAPLAIRNGKPLEDTGGLKASWSVDRKGKRGFSIISHKAYAIFHQEGTGIHGPRKKPIKPKKKGGVLAFKGPSGTIFAKSVKGAPKRRMLPREHLPPLWQKRLKETAIETLEELYRK
jgi:phage gpG-like protein